MYFTDIFKLEEKIGTYLLIGEVGSKSYGTDTPESDHDLVAIAVAPKSTYTGLDKWENDGTLKMDRKSTDNAELTAFELKKFLRLALAFNPNVIPLLYLRPSFHYYQTNGGNAIVENRHWFTSKRAYHTLIGYAEGQRKAVVNCETGKLGMKRKELVAQYGYDVKFAAHTIRILRMATEFFKTGDFNVYREDRDHLLDIRKGKFTMQEWLKEVDELTLEAKDAEKDSKLPEHPQYDKINRLCMDLIEEYALD
jgi:uncharacterized protein